VLRNRPPPAGLLFLHTPSALQARFVPPNPGLDGPAARTAHRQPQAKRSHVHSTGHAPVRRHRPRDHGRQATQSQHARRPRLPRPVPERAGPGGRGIVHQLQEAEAFYLNNRGEIGRMATSPTATSTWRCWSQPAWQHVRDYPGHQAPAWYPRISARRRAASPIPATSSPRLASGSPQVSSRGSHNNHGNVTQPIALTPSKSTDIGEPPGRRGANTLRPGGEGLSTGEFPRPHRAALPRRCAM